MPMEPAERMTSFLAEIVMGLVSVLMLGVPVKTTVLKTGTVAAEVMVASPEVAGAVPD